jgi:amino acid adenylation domain-containing protein
MVNDTPVAPAASSVEEKRRLLAQKLQARAQRGEFPLSFSQQRLWFLHRMDPHSAAYHIPLALRARGGLDVDVLRRALRAVVQRHEALRTVFAEREGRVVQIVAQQAPDVLAQVDLRGMDPAAREDELRRLADEAATTPFDLRRGPLLRALAVRLDDAEWGLLFTLHHVVADGWSMGLLVRELSECYAAFAEGREPALAAPGMQFPEFALWQRGWLRGETLQAETAWWREQLAGAPRVLELPTDRPRSASAGARGGRRPFRLGAQTSAGLAALAREEGATLFMTLLAAWQLLLGRYAGQDDVLVGTPIAGRTRAELEGVVGFFVNTLVLRARLDDGLTFRGLLAQVRETTLGAYAHQHLPFEKLVEEMGVERSLAHTPLFQALFTLQNAERETLSLGGAGLETLATGTETAKFDLGLTAAEGPQGIGGSLAYRADLFDGATAERMLAHYTALLDAVAADADRPLADYALLDDAERARVLVEWNGTNRPIPDTGLHGLVEAQAARTPDAPAVVFGARVVTYGELDRRANRIARRLQRRGVGPETRVALHLENGPEQVAAVLGVLKAGGAYVPLDTASPADRLAYVLADSGAALVLADEGAVLPEGAPPVLSIGPDAFADEAEDAPACAAGPRSLAYVIYTSGSTGRPKGVGVEHRSAVNVTGVYVDTYGLGDGDRVLQFAPVHFDPSVTDLFGALAAGAALVSAPRDAMVPGPDLVDLMREQGVTHARFSPSALAALPYAELPALRALLTGGEPCPAELVARWAPGRRFLNGYGPTEASVRVAVAECVDGTRTPPIGRPVANARLYVVDGRGDPLPAGIPGELYIGGAGVARGYLGRPALTAERFVPDPFGPEPGARLYRSGDRVRWLPDGQLDFVGRVDFQVKIRGFRIEPGEVEAALRLHPAVAETVVVARESASGGARLVAYVVPASVDAPPSPAILREHLAARLPDYMVPGAFVALERLPLGPSGKTDRRALPAPALSGDEAVYVAPRGAAEEIVAGIFAEVLGAERVGAHDDFFALGGHSLVATRVLWRIRDAFGVELPLRALFEEPSVAGLAGRVEALAFDDGTTPPPPIVPVPRGRALPLSFAQRRMWFLHQLEPAGTAYSMPYVLRLRGALDADALEQALNEVVRRHESLRTRFAEEDGEPLQLIDPPHPVPLPRIDLRGEGEDAREAALRAHVADEAARPFDLAAGPVLRAALLRLADDEHALLVTLHHIASDAWSQGLLVREVSALYADFAAGRAPSLPPLPVQYADFAVWQNARLEGPALEAELEYWRERLAGAPPLLEVPTDRPRGAAAGERAGSVPLRLGEETSAALRTLARREGATLFMTLLAGWQLLLSRWSGQDDVVVGAPVANRTQPETAGLIGFFVNTLALRTDLSGDPTVRGLLARVRDGVLQAQARQELPFERLVEALGVDRALDRTPLFQAVLAFQEAAGDAPDLGGLAAEALASAPASAKFDLTLAIGDGGAALGGSLVYRADLFDAATAERMAEQLAIVLREMAADPERRLSRIPFVSGDERAALLARSGTDAVDAPRPIHHLFAERAAAAPDAPAVVLGDEALAYGELDARANRLAHHLRALGVGPDVKVAVCLERTLELPVALLAILKAGGAYVPLDLSYPPERLAFMVRDADVRVLLTQESLRGTVPAHAGPVVSVDGDAEQIALHPSGAPESGVTAEHLAYVIYTSGSTGTPKGTEVPHRAIPGYFRSADYVSFDADQVHLQHASLSWDVLTLELWSALLTGARCVLYPGRASEPEMLGEQVRRHGVTVLWLSSAYFNLVVDTYPEILAGVRQVMTGGEAVSPAHVRRALETVPGLRLVNGYGPSECTVFASAYVIPADFDAPAVPIGSPVGDRRVYLVDGGMELVPAGVPGELCVGGPAVARGYLGLPALTADRFVPDPFSAVPGARLYRTGDRVRWTAAGVLEFVGRVDFQAKVRGFRVEPGEVEAALRADARVRQAVAVVREDAPGDRRLVAYAVPAEGADVSAAELRSGLRARLPEYLVPSAVVVLDAFPLSRTGKVDRARLPAPDVHGDEDAYVLPRTPVEEVLAGMYAELLNAVRVGARDDFFALGGHSLLATRLVSRVRGAFGVELPLRALFEAPSVEALAARVEALRREGAARLAPPLVPVGRDRPLPLSFAQQRLWFIDQLEPGSAAYNLPFALRLRGPLDVPALERTLAELVRRHETLRTRFAGEGGRAVQVIDPPAPVPLLLDDLRRLSAFDREERALAMAADEARRPFELQFGPLVRAALLRVDDDEHVLLLTLHHIIADGWSLGVLSREVSALYAAFSAGRESSLPPLPIQYGDYAAWQRAWLTGDTLDAELAYWRDQLAGAPPLLDLPTDRARAGTPGAEAASVAFALGGETTGMLRALAREEGATLFMTLLAAWQLLLSRYAGQDDVSVGTPLAGRTRLETEGLIGFFVNTLVLRTDLSGNPTFRALLRRVRETTLGAYGHQDIPFEKLVEELAPERALGHTPFFQVLFALQNNARETLDLGPVQAERLAGDAEAAKFDLALGVTETGDGLAGSLRYRTALWDGTTAARMLEHWGALLEALAADPDRPVDTVSFLGEAERHRIVEGWKGVEAPDPGDALVHEMIAAQAARTPEAVALRFGETSVTYAQLDRRANQLANSLRRRGVGTESIVGVCAERSPELVVALLGVLKAGAAYVAMDPAHPAERLRYVLEDARVSLLLAQARVAASLPLDGVDVLRLDDDWFVVAAESDEAPVTGVLPGNLAYVLYTSGSTGRPKGVQTEHRSVAAMLQWLASHVRAEDAACVLGSTSITFDVSVPEIFGTLCRGGRLVLVGNALDLAGLPATEGIRLAAMVPGAAGELLRMGALPPTLRALNLGGEALPAPLARGLHESAVDRVVNLYGPTEVTVYSTFNEVPRGEDRVTIGRPVDGVRAYVLDGGMNPVPAGVTGELYLGGVQVTRGYLRRPGLTADRYVPDPFSPFGGGRLYRTGDRVRWTADGELDYLGRIDFQVKVRGFRIEPGEIEAALREIAGVGEAAVVAREDVPGDRRLVAYLTADGPAPDAAALRAGLKARLPEYMVPAAFVWMDALPLGTSGKIDRAALPAPDFGADAGAYVAPRTPMEEILAGLFEEVLAFGAVSRDGRVGARSSFFELGGHSLLATRLVLRVQETFGVEVPLRLLFEAPTVEAMAARVEALRRDGLPVLPPVVPVGRDAPLPLSFAQERLWFLDRLEEGGSFYNIATGLHLNGPLDPSALERALGEIVRRHEALRTVFRQEEGAPIQVIVPFTGFVLPVAELSGAQEADVRRLAADEGVRPFDLAAGPLFRATLLRLAPEAHVLLLTMHHVVSDGWSLGVLLREMSALYAALRAGEAPSLPPLPVQYADYAVWQREHLQGEVLGRQLAYWKERLAGAPELLPLATDHPRPPALTYRGERIPVALSASLVERLEAVGRAEGATLFMVLLGAFGVMLSRYSGSEDIVVGSPIAGRTRGEVEGLIGFFANTLVLRTDLSGDPPFRALLRRVREATLGAYEHQDVPFEKLVAELQPERSLSHTPLFQAMLILQNTELADGGMAGLDVRPAELETTTSKFDVMLGLATRASGVSGVLEYSTDLFERATAERMLEHLDAVLAQVAENPDLRLSELELMNAAERGRVLSGWARAEAAESAPALVHERIQAQAARTPDAPAVTFGGETLTYGALNARANRIAHRLAGLGVGPEVPVAVLLERGPALVAAILGVLKAGGAYVPLDPGQPPARLSLIAADAGVPVLLTEASLADSVDVPAGVHVLRVDGDDGIESSPETDLPPRAAAESLAYVIYTSGSTGTPKGVMMPHGALAALVAWHAADPALAAPRRTLQFSALGFDVAFQEIAVTLASGGELVLVDDELRRDPRRLVELLSGAGVERLFLPFVALQSLAEAAADSGVPLALREVVTAGEQLVSTPQIQALFRGIPGARLFNHYGPTETHVATAHALPADPAAWSALPPVGRPVPGTDAYVLDASLRPVPQGVHGELYVGGAQVARGYLRRPALTAERFVPDPFGAPGARLYATGDRARWRNDGELEYLGRRDHQLKIRGYRVELGEIEAVLRRHPGVADCVVDARDGAGGVRLVGYVVPAEADAGQVDAGRVDAGRVDAGRVDAGRVDAGRVDAGRVDAGRVDASALREHLRTVLPEYMVPAAWVALERLPVSPNGKVDRRALPAPEPASADPRGEAPRTPTEQILAAIWSEVLGMEGVGVHDDFFALGGHSLLATQVATRARAAFGTELPVRVLFQEPTVAGLAAWVDARRTGAGHDEPPPIQAVAEPGVWLPASFAQRRLWLEQQLNPESRVYNQGLALRLRGRLDAAALEAALAELVRRHAVFRTRFEARGDEPGQVILPAGPVPLPCVDLSGVAEAEPALRGIVRAHTRRFFDLGAGELLRTLLVRLGEDEHALVIAMHHITNDGWSLPILFRELAELYAAFAEGRPSPFPEPALQYADFAVWQRAWLTAEREDAQLAFWRRRLEGVPRLRLQTDRARASDGTDGALQPFSLPPALSEDVRRLSRSLGATPFMTLLAAFNVLLHWQGGDEEIVLGTDIANRNLRAETEGMIGFFVNQLVLRTPLGGNPDFRAVVGRVREETLAAYDHQDVPFDRVVEALRPPRAPGETPFFRAKFVLQNTPAGDGVVQLPGLTLESIPTERGAAQLDVLLAMDDRGERMTGRWEYRTSLFSADLIGRWTRRLQAVLEAAVADPSQGLDALRAHLDAEERREGQDARDALKEKRRARFAR